MARRPRRSKSPNPIHPRVSDAKAYEQALRQAYLDPFFRRLRRQLATAAGAQQALATMSNVVGQIVAMPRAGVPLREIQRALNRLNGYHRQRVVETFQKALAVDVTPLLGTAPIKAIMDQSIDDNVRLLKTIPPRAHQGLVKQLQAELQKAPFDQEMMSNVLKQQYNVAGYNVRRIAQDQTSKVIGQLTRARHEQLGVNQYRWLTSRDERVRVQHQVNDGKVFSWSTPPPTLHPGQSIMCRCVATPILSEETQAKLRQQTAPVPAGVEQKPSPIIVSGRPGLPPPRGFGPDWPRLPPPPRDPDLGWPGLPPPDRPPGLPQLPPPPRQLPPPRHPGLDETTATLFNRITTHRLLPDQIYNAHRRHPNFQALDYKSVMQAFNKVYTSINSAIRFSRKMSRTLKRVNQRMARLSKNLKSDIRFYKGVSEGEMPSPGDVISTNAWTSGSTSAARAEDAGDVLWDIQMRRGSRAIVTNAEQGEVIIPPGSKINVLDVVDCGKRADNPRKVKCRVIAKIADDTEAEAKLPAIKAPDSTGVSVGQAISTAGDVVAGTAKVATETVNIATTVAKALISTARLVDDAADITGKIASTVKLALDGRIGKLMTQALPDAVDDLVESVGKVRTLDELKALFKGDDDALETLARVSDDLEPPVLAVVEDLPPPTLVDEVVDEVMDLAPAPANRLPHSLVKGFNFRKAQSPEEFSEELSLWRELMNRDKPKLKERFKNYPEYTAEGLAEQIPLISSDPLTFYVKSAFDRFNEAMSGSRPMVEQYLQVNLGLHKLLKPTSDRMRLFRGTGDQPGLADARPGDIIDTDRWTSTTPNLQEAGLWSGGNYLLDIRAPKGTPMIITNADEFEAMLPPETRFRVLDVQDGVEPLKSRIITLEIEPDDRVLSADVASAAVSKVVSRADPSVEYTDDFVQPIEIQTARFYIEDELSVRDPALAREFVSKMFVPESIFEDIEPYARDLRKLIAEYDVKSVGFLDDSPWEMGIRINREIADKATGRPLPPAALDDTVRDKIDWDTAKRLIRDELDKRSPDGGASFWQTHMYKSLTLKELGDFVIENEIKSVTVDALGMYRAPKLVDEVVEEVTGLVPAPVLSRVDGFDFGKAQTANEFADESRLAKEIWDSKPNRDASIDAFERHPDYQIASEGIPRTLDDPLDYYIFSSEVPDFNEALAGRKPMTAKFREINDGLKEYLKPLSEDMRVFRGVRPDFVLSKFQPGDVIDDPRWTSTSTSLAVADRFGGGENLIDLRVPKGTRAIMTNAGEQEVVLPPGTKYRVIDVHVEDGKRRITAEVVPDDVVPRLPAAADDLVPLVDEDDFLKMVAVRIEAQIQDLRKVDKPKNPYLLPFLVKEAEMLAKSRTSRRVYGKVPLQSVSKVVERILDGEAVEDIFSISIVDDIPLTQVKGFDFRKAQSAEEFAEEKRLAFEVERDWDRLKTERAEFESHADYQEVGSLEQKLPLTGGDSLNFYVESGKSFNFNDALAGRAGMTTEFKEVNTGLMEYLKPISQDMRLFRGVGSQADLPEFRPGEIISGPRWTSTSASLPVADRFAREAIIDLRVPKGTRAIMTNVSEQEVILPPGTQTRIIDDVRDDDGMRRITAEVVPDTEAPRLPAVAEVDEARPPPAVDADFDSILYAETVEARDVFEETGEVLWRPPSRIVDEHRNLPAYIEADANDFLEKYVGDVTYYRRLNEKLRRREKLSEYDKRIVDEILSTARPVENEMRVFRGVDANQDLLDSLQEGAVLDHDSFLSTTRSTMVASRFSREDGVIFDIEVPEGTPAIVTNASELEVIFPPNHKLEIISVDRSKPLDILGQLKGSIHYVRARVVDYDRQLAPTTPLVEDLPVPRVPHPALQPGGDIDSLIDSMWPVGKSHLDLMDESNQAHMKLPHFIPEDSHPSLEVYVNAFEEYENLWSNLLLGRSLSAKERKIVTDLENLARPLEEDMRVFRGLTDVTEPFREGDIIDQKSFVSTSTSPFESFDFALGPDAVLFDIKVPKGTRGIITNQSEQEVILLPGHKMRLLSVEDKRELSRGPDQGTKLVKYIVAEITPPDEVPVPQASTLTATFDDVVEEIPAPAVTDDVSRVPVVPSRGAHPGLEESRDSLEARLKADDAPPGTMRREEKMQEHLRREDHVPVTMNDGLRDYVNSPNPDFINTSLRKGEELGERARKIQDELMGLLTPLQEDLRVYRGVKFDHVHASEGEILDFPEWFSTSTSIGTAREFGSQILDIQLRAGTRKILTNPAEQEVILPPGGRFRVLRVDDFTAPDSALRQRIVLEQVDDAEAPIVPIAGKVSDDVAPPVSKAGEAIGDAAEPFDTPVDQIIQYTDELAEAIDRKTAKRLIFEELQTRDPALADEYWSKVKDVTPWVKSISKYIDEYDAKSVSVSGGEIYRMGVRPMDGVFDEVATEASKVPVRGDGVLPAIPRMPAVNMKAKRTGGQQGSNPGGTYLGEDGIERYVKDYTEATQAYGEAVANSVYRGMGLKAPESVLSEDGLTIGNRIIRNDGDIGPDFSVAEAFKILDGFVADVLVDNWDVVGLGFDNIVRVGNDLARIDAGGALLHRAQGALKPKGGLEAIGEWDSFISMNPQYARVFDVAGLDYADYPAAWWLVSLERQMDNMIALREKTNNFADMVPEAAGVSRGDREQILAMLQERSRLLERKIRDLLPEAEVRPVPLADDAVEELPARAPPVEVAEPSPVPVGVHSGLDESVESIEKRIDEERNAGLDSVHENRPDYVSYRDHEMISHYVLSSDDYGLNTALRNGDELTYEAVKINEGLTELVTPLGEDLRVYRGIPLSFATMNEGDILDFREWVSTTTSVRTAKTFGDALLDIQLKPGIPKIVTNSDEQEVILAPGGEFRVLKIEDWGEDGTFRKRVVLEQVEDTEAALPASVVEAVDDVAPEPLPPPPLPVPQLVDDFDSVLASEKNEMIWHRDGSLRPSDEMELSHTLLPDFVDQDSDDVLKDYVEDYIFMAAMFRKLRSGAELTDEERKKYTHLVSLARPLEEEMRVFRGMQVDQETLDSFQVGDVVDQRSFVSTSRVAMVAAQFAEGDVPVILDIKAPKGTPAIITNPSEQEVILLPGHRLRILSSEEKTMPYAPFGGKFEERRIRLITAEVVADDAVGAAKPTSDMENRAVEDLVKALMAVSSSLVEYASAHGGQHGKSATA